MKKYLTTLLAACCMLAAFSMPASALEYHFDGPDAGLFGRPTCDDTIYVTAAESVNTNRSKDAAYIPPAFGSPTSYTLNAGELLTPNLVSGSVAGTISGTGGVTVLPPTTSGSSSGNAGSYTPVKYTAVTKDLYYSGGYLGTLKIPTLGLSVKVYQGTDADALRKGAGHFASTSIWEGNVAIAGHNRGVNNHFGKIHTLDIGDKQICKAVSKAQHRAVWRDAGLRVQFHSSARRKSRIFRCLIPFRLISSSSRETTYLGKLSRISQGEVAR